MEKSDYFFSPLFRAFFVFKRVNVDINLDNLLTDVDFATPEWYDDFVSLPATQNMRK